MITKEELEKIVLECSSKTGLATKLGYKNHNGQTFKKIMILVNKFEISIEHFGERTKKYKRIMKSCPICHIEFEVGLGEPREKTTCSIGCSNTYFANIRHTLESKQNVSNSLLKFHELNGTVQKLVIKHCPFCNKEFETKRKKKKFCSNQCSSTANWKNSEYREKFYENFKIRLDAGKHKGWAKRSNLNPSFPEKYFTAILNENSINYVQEFKVGKWFVDFADMDRKIALEIDGKQHELPERKNSDEQKDKFLTENGWKVFRIKWKKPTKLLREMWVADIQNLFKRKID